MKDALYTAEARVTGGRLQGRGRSSDGAVDIQLGMPTELGGEGEGANPEQLYAICHGACFASAIETAARRTKQAVGEIVVDSTVSLMRDAQRSFSLRLSLDVQLPGVADFEEAKELVAAADEICPYSRGGNVPVRLSVNGAPVRCSDPGPEL